MFLLAADIEYFQYAHHMFNFLSLTKKLMNRIITLLANNYVLKYILII